MPKSMKNKLKLSFTLSLFLIGAMVIFYSHLLAAGLCHCGCHLENCGCYFKTCQNGDCSGTCPGNGTCRWRSGGSISGCDQNPPCGGNNKKCPGDCCGVATAVKGSCNWCPSGGLSQCRGQKKSCICWELIDSEGDPTGVFVKCTNCVDYCTTNSSCPRCSASCTTRCNHKACPGTIKIDHYAPPETFGIGPCGCKNASPWNCTGAGSNTSDACCSGCSASGRWGIGCVGTSGSCDPHCGSANCPCGSSRACHCSQYSGEQPCEAANPPWSGKCKRCNAKGAGLFCGIVPYDMECTSNLLHDPP